jgi:hypothetical protein
VRTLLFWQGKRKFGDPAIQKRMPLLHTDQCGVPVPALVKMSVYTAVEILIYSLLYAGGAIEWHRPYPVQ